MTDDPIRPSVKITEPEPLKVIDRKASDVEIMVRPFALGECRVLLNIVADECAFWVGNEMKNQNENIEELNHGNSDLYDWNSLIEILNNSNKKPMRLQLCF